jgi:hypothetical protein
MLTQRLARGGTRVEARRYALEILPAESLARLTVKGTLQRYLFFPCGACNTTTRRDDTRRVGRVSFNEAHGAVTLAFSEDSALWRNKRHTWVCREDSIEVSYELQGKGAVERAQFFRGYVGGEERGMAGEFDEIYTTCPNFQERLYFHPGESFGISAGDYLDLPVGAQAFASPCYCLGLHDRRDKGFLSAGLAAAPGDYTWDCFQWNPSALIPPTAYIGDAALGGGFAAIYDGKLKVDGCWRSPRLVLTFARSQEEVLQRYLNHCYAHGYLPRFPRRKEPAWWREPIFCTWHEQAALALSAERMDAKGGRDAKDFCTQELSERWLRTLERHDCKPGTVILDATWAANLNSGEPDKSKWPDMRGWIEACHARGVRVFLWMLAWSPQGLPPEECVCRAGKPLTADITHPRYLKRFKEMVRRFFSDAPDALNSDGIKVDGLLLLPTGKALRSRGGIWGLELQRLYLKTLHDEARKLKSDACISTFTLNPYLADCVDMVRLGDMYTHRPTPVESMRHRAALCRIALPHTPVDTDGQLRFHPAEGYQPVFAEQARLGIPTLYNAEMLWRYRFLLPAVTRRLTPADYREFARVMADYRRRMRSSGG